MKVVFNQPIGELTVKNGHIVAGVPQTYELILESTVETLAYSVILGRLCPAPPMLKVKLFRGTHEILMKFTAVVRLDMDHLAIHKQM